jgi:hypothetical protein
MAVATATAFEKATDKLLKKGARPFWSFEGLGFGAKLPAGLSRQQQHYPNPF